MSWIFEGLCVYFKPQPIQHLHSPFGYLSTKEISNLNEINELLFFHPMLYLKFHYKVAKSDGEVEENFKWMLTSEMMTTFEQQEMVRWYIFWNAIYKVVVVVVW